LLVFAGWGLFRRVECFYVVQVQAKHGLDLFFLQAQFLRWCVVSKQKDLVELSVAAGG